MQKKKSGVKKCLEICAIKGGGGGGRLMANAILNFHFDYLNPSLRNNQGLKKNNSQYLSIECINSRELGRPESIIFFIFFRENKASFPRTKNGVFNPPPLSLPRNKFFPNINLMSQNSLLGPFSFRF